jgi:hypothetical protein
LGHRNNKGGGPDTERQEKCAVVHHGHFVGICGRILALGEKEQMEKDDVVSKLSASFNLSSTRAVTSYELRVREGKFSSFIFQFLVGISRGLASWIMVIFIIR